MQKFDLKQVKIVDSIGKPLEIPDLHMQIGNTLYYVSKNRLPIFVLGNKIALNEPFDISENDINEFIEYVEEWELSFHVKLPLLEYLKQLKSNEITTKTNSPLAGGMEG
jgi:hypothetical protein